MLKQRLTHPDILSALASAGQGARVLIADGNYPASTEIGENASLVYLNLAPGKPTVTEVLDILLTAVSVEDAWVMDPSDAPQPRVFQEFRSLISNIVLNGLGRYEFYDEVSGPNTCLIIVTGDQRPYASLLVALGAVTP